MTPTVGFRTDSILNVLSESSMGNAEKTLLERLRSDGAIHLTLIDPEKMAAKEASRVSKILAEHGTTAVMVGGSTLASTPQLDTVVRAIKSAVKIPVILFPNTVSAISRYADAVWFMSLLNSSNPIFITGFQALGAPIVRRYKLEVLPLGYIIISAGSTAAFIGQAQTIPLDKPEVASLYALAAQYLGMRYVYLEAGSGAKTPIPAEMVRIVANTVDIPVIVGGGIRDPEDAVTAVRAGASAVVTGTICEKDPSGGMVGKIVDAIRLEGRHRLGKTGL